MSKLFVKYVILVNLVSLILQNQIVLLEKQDHHLIKQLKFGIQKIKKICTAIKSICGHLESCYGFCTLEMMYVPSSPPTSSSIGAVNTFTLKQCSFILPANTPASPNHIRFFLSRESSSEKGEGCSSSRLSWNMLFGSTGPENEFVYPIACLVLLFLIALGTIF